ncbi:MAG: tRNA (guanine(10)-N(2))-dimethyltransferase [Candidatus Hadarchaeales archaeon]
MVRVTEGKVILEVPRLEDFRAPTGDYVPSRAEVFYNPHVEMARDIAVAVAQAAVEILGKLRICDPFAGVGVRGLRYACEVEGVERVVISDVSQKAIDIIKKNLELNKPMVEVSVVRSDANVLLHEMRGRFNFVDLDPFGSPAPFVEAACVSLSRAGVLAVTATDTAALCGSAPSACLRKYGAVSLRTEYCHELGARILIGFIQRVAAKHDLAFFPLLTHLSRHQLRVYLFGKRSSGSAFGVLKEQGFVSHCFSCSRRYLTKGTAAELPSSCDCGEDLAHAGPLWLGSIFDKNFVLKVLEEVGRRKFRQRSQEFRLLSMCVNEAEGPPTFFDLNVMASVAGISPPKFSRIEEALKSSGYFFSRTHFSPTGFRTDAPYDFLISLF